jgi:hypothetical protein
MDSSVSTTERVKARAEKNVPTQAKAIPMARSAQVLVPTETPFHAPMLNNNENARKEAPKTFNEF